jgi:hypothetical protein
MKKQFIFCFLSILLIVAFSGCIGENSTLGNSVIQNGSVDSNKDSASVTKLEVYHFHRTQQCPTCIRLGELTEDTIKLYFSEEVKAGTVVFGHINIDLPENKELVDRYEPAGSSLYVGTYFENGTFEKEENTNVWYKVSSSREEYLSYLKEVLDKKIGKA